MARGWHGHSRAHADAGRLGGLSRGRRMKDKSKNKGSRQSIRTTDQSEQSY